MPVIQPPVVPPLKNTSQDVVTFLGQITRWAATEMGKLLPRNEGVNHIFLVSPSQKVYQVTVDDSGTLHTTLIVPGKIGV